MQLFANESNEIRTNMYLNIINTNPNWFQPYNKNGSIPKLKNDFEDNTFNNANKIYNRLTNSVHFKEEAKDVYEAYLYYSKYDHFGQMFYELSRQHFLDRFRNVEQVITITLPKILY